MPFTYEYERPSLTVDVALVTREPRPRVLLIQRKKAPFAGAWALPGGFVDAREPLARAALRELQEETGVGGVAIQQLAAFGDPGRDPRGWTVSVAFVGRVDEAVPPAAADDAAAADWHPLDALPPLAFDHAAILAVVGSRIKD